MADYQLISPKYSLVDFRAPIVQACCNDQEAPLPFFDNADLRFQIDAVTNTESQANDIIAASGSLIKLLILSPAGDLIRNITDTDGNEFKKFRTSLKTVTFIWHWPLPFATELVGVNNCFMLGITSSFDTSDEPEAVNVNSNIFKVVASSCYTSLLEYYNEQDHQEFHYCNVRNNSDLSQPAVSNRARLFMHAGRPKFLEEKKIYRKSQGQIKQRYSQLTKEYLMQTEYYSELTHDKIAVALTHDAVSIVTDKFSGIISKNGDYDVDWQDGTCVGPAEFKAISEPFFIKNNNCGTCPPPII